jgi:hypothetical protein
VAEFNLRGRRGLVWYRTTTLDPIDEKMPVKTRLHWLTSDYCREREEGGEGVATVLPKSGMKA